MQHLQNFYAYLVKAGQSLQSPLLLAVRLFWGYQFFDAGFSKLQDISSIAEYFSKLNIPFPHLNAYLAGGTECIGGALLFLGLFARLASIPLMIVMCVAFLTAESEALRNVFADPTHFISRTPFTFLLASLLIFVFGPGKFSLDRLLGLDGKDTSVKF